MNDGDIIISDKGPVYDWHDKNKEAMKILDGEIQVDSSDFAKHIGFTSDKFMKGSYLWMHQKRKEVYVSFIHATEQRKGYFTGLCQSLWALGYKVKVPTPSNMMRGFLAKHGFKETLENDDEMNDVCEVWIK